MRAPCDALCGTLTGSSARPLLCGTQHQSARRTWAEAVLVNLAMGLIS